MLQITGVCAKHTYAHQTRAVGHNRYISAPDACSMDRPTFDWQGKPVRAAGILCWTMRRGQTHRLFRKIKGKFEDIGGKTDVVDADPQATAVREACEETDGKLFSPYHTREQCAAILQPLVRYCRDVEYNARSKYLVFKIEVPPSILDLPMTRFGLREKTDWGILQHYYQWRWVVPFTNQLHWRLKGLNL